MSLLPSFIKARRRQNDSAPQTDAAADSHIADSRTRDSHIGDSHDAELDDNVFNLLPPESPRHPGVSAIPRFSGIFTLPACAASPFAAARRTETRSPANFIPPPHPGPVANPSRDSEWLKKC